MVNCNRRDEIKAELDYLQFTVAFHQEMIKFCDKQNGRRNSDGVIVDNDTGNFIANISVELQTVLNGLPPTEQLQGRWKTQAEKLKEEMTKTVKGLDEANKKLKGLGPPSLFPGGSQGYDAWIATLGGILSSALGGFGIFAEGLVVPVVSATGATIGHTIVLSFTGGFWIGLGSAALIGAVALPLGGIAYAVYRVQTDPRLNYSTYMWKHNIQMSLIESARRQRQLQKELDEIKRFCTYDPVCPDKPDQVTYRYFDPQTIKSKIDDDNLSLSNFAVGSLTKKDSRITDANAEIQRLTSERALLQSEQEAFLSYTNSILNLFANDKIKVNNEDKQVCKKEAREYIYANLQNKPLPAGFESSNEFINSRNILQAYCLLHKYKDKACNAFSIAGSTQDFKTPDFDKVVKSVSKTAKNIKNDICFAQLEPTTSLQIKCDNEGNCRAFSSTGRTIAPPQGWSAVYMGSGMPSKHENAKNQIEQALKTVNGKAINQRIVKYNTQIETLTKKIVKIQDKNKEAWSTYLLDQIDNYYNSVSIDSIGKGSATAPSTKGLKNSGGSPFQTVRKFVTVGGKGAPWTFDHNKRAYEITVKLEQSHLNFFLDVIEQRTGLNWITQNDVNWQNINTIKGFTREGSSYQASINIASSQAWPKLDPVTEKIMGSDVVSPINKDFTLSICAE
jgi:hypothetical protein